MKRLDKFLTSILAGASGFILSSLWITDSDNWKLALPVALVIIAWKEHTKDLKK